MGNHGRFSVSPLKSDLSFLPSFPQGERVLGDAEVPLYRRGGCVVTGGHFSMLAAAVLVGVLGYQVVRVSVVHLCS